MSEMSQTDPAERDTAICDLGRHIGSRISRRDATPSGYVDGRLCSGNHIRLMRETGTVQLGASCGRVALRAPCEKLI